MVQPLFVGALIDDADYGLALAGQVIAANMGGSFIGSLSTMWLLRRAGVEFLICLGTALVVAGSVWGASSVPQPNAFTLANAIAGCGVGIAMSSGAACASGFGNPERLFAWIMVGQASLGALLLLIGRTMLNGLGIGGSLIAVALLCMTQLLFLRHFAAPRIPPAGATISIGPQARLVLLSLLLFSIGNAGLYANLERFARLQDMDLEWVGPALAVAQICGLLGSLFAVWLSAGSPYVRSVTIGCCAIMCATILIGLTDSPALMAASFAVFLAAIGFSIPFYFGALASADSTGRTIIIGQLVMLFGFAIGPLGAGLIGEILSLPVLSGAAVALFACALVAIRLRSRPAHE